MVLCQLLIGGLKMFRKHFIIILMTVLGLFLINGCATLPKHFDKPPSYAYTDTDDTAFGRARSDERMAHPGQSGFLLLGNGLDAFVARAVLAHYAERSIDVQYYLYHDDLVGALFTDQLLKAADRGVRVRLVVDDMDLADRDLGAAVLDSHPNKGAHIQSIQPKDRQNVTVCDPNGFGDATYAQQNVYGGQPGKHLRGTQYRQRIFRS